MVQGVEKKVSYVPNNQSQRNRNQSPPNHGQAWDYSERHKGSLKQEIEKQIAYTQYGLIGESNIAFELKNSNMDMYILHDIYIECDDLSAQIDYIIITRKRIYVIECKNLIGNIEVNNRGEFTRTYELLGKKIKEGI